MFDSYVCLPVSDAEMAEAYARWKDKGYSNETSIAGNKEKKTKHVGELGLIKTAQWLRQTGVDFEQVSESLKSADYLVDFLINGYPVAVRSIWRNCKCFYDHYGCQISAKQFNFFPGHIFFTSYHHPLKEIRLIGGIDKEYFLEKSDEYKPGEWVGGNYPVPENHLVWDVQARYTTPPEEWLRLLR